MRTLASLCSGYGGLDLAVEQVVGPVVHRCFVEFDKHPSAILAHHYPGVPNLGDVKALAWAAPGIDILSAGYPCQPFSAAGKRKGADDPRHLWPSISAGIALSRPRVLCLENVRGHLSLGFDVVLTDLHRLGYDVRWTLLRAADVGACHGRARLFILAHDREHGGFPAPSGEPFAAVGDLGLVEPHLGLFGEVELGESLPTSGALVGGTLWALPGVAAGSPAVLLPTPVADHSRGLAQPGSSYQSLPNVVMLLPTPTSRDHKGANQRSDDTCLTGALLPTPATTDAKGARNSTSGRKADSQHTGQLVDEDGQPVDHVMQRTFDPATGRMVQTGLPQAVNLLPTPKASDGDKGGPMLPSAVQPERWGAYAAAIARHALLAGRPAPDPTEPGSKGQPRLSPRFVEFMMGLPDGWVTGVDIPRVAMLKALGNGVVPVQAAVAFTSLGLPGLVSERVAA